VAQSGRPSAREAARSRHSPHNLVLAEARNRLGKVNVVVAERPRPGRRSARSVRWRDLGAVGPRSHGSARPGGRGEAGPGPDRRREAGPDVPQYEPLRGDHDAYQGPNRC